MTESAAKETQEEVDPLEIAHEAAHAVFHFRFGHRLTRVTIQPGEGALGGAGGSPGQAAIS